MIFYGKQVTNMNRKIVQMNYTNNGVQIPYELYPEDLEPADYEGLFQEMIYHVLNDFFEFEQKEDKYNVSFSLLADLHYFTDVYQLRPESFTDALNDADLQPESYEVNLFYDNDENLTINFDGQIGPAEVVSAIAILMGHILTHEQVSEVLVSTNFAMIDELNEDGIN